MARSRGLVKFFKNRKLRVDILTLFLFLNVISFSLVISFSYIENYRSISEFSKDTAIRASHQVVDRLEFLGFDIEEMLVDFAGLFREAKDFSLEDERLTFFMLNAVKYNANLAALFVASPDGRILSVGDLSLSKQASYKSKTDEQLPKEAGYVVKVVDPQKMPEEIWYYKDKEDHTVDQESFQKALLNPRSRPWYRGALQTQGFFWTDVYSFIGAEEAGITASKVIFDEEGHPMLIVGADLSFVLLDKFLDSQTIGKSGRAFILDSNGDILVSGLSGNEEVYAKKRVKEALKTYKKDGTDQFTFVSEGTRYLGYITQIPAQFGRDWRLAIIVPFRDFFSDLIQTQVIIVGITLLILIVTAFITYYFARRISGPIVALVKEIDKLTHLELKSDKRVRSHIEEVRLLDQAIASMRVALRSFMRYVPKEIIHHLFESRKEVALGGEKREVTIFFSDIQGFTPLAEKYSTDFLMPLLAEYFDGISKIILQEMGTIDKYIGDSVMAFWGAPQETTDHSYRACVAALHCHQFVDEFNKKRRSLQQPEFITRFGIHTGVVVVGNIGTSERMNYTVIGDAVNATSRLQAAAKNYHVAILMSGELQKKVDKDVLTRPLDEIEVKGKEKRIEIYELMASKHSGPLKATEEQEILSQQFTEAYRLFSKGDKAKAHELLNVLVASYPDDFPIKRLLEL